MIADAFTPRPRLERDGPDFVVTPPTYRFDLAIEEYFIEEVARMHGRMIAFPTPAAHVQPMLLARGAHVAEVRAGPLRATG